MAWWVVSPRLFGFEAYAHSLSSPSLNGMVVQPGVRSKEMPPAGPMRDQPPDRGAGRGQRETTAVALARKARAGVGARARIGMRSAIR
jgi:hypothetical protein